MVDGTLRIRLFDPEDQPAARALVLDGLRERFGGIDPARNLDLDDIAATYLAAGHCFVVAERGGQLIGTGALLFHEAGMGQMARLSVRRAARRQGIGQALVDHLTEVARRAGLRQLWVETNHDWREAIALYERCGFVAYARDEESVYLARAVG